MANSVRVDSASVRNLSKNILTEVDVLLQMIDKARNKVAESGAVFDSPAAQEFRKKMDSFAETAKNGSRESLTNLANYFEAVAKTYEKADEEVLDVANQYLSTDIFE